MFWQGFVWCRKAIRAVKYPCHLSTKFLGISGGTNKSELVHPGSREERQLKCGVLFPNTDHSLVLIKVSLCLWMADKHRTKTAKNHLCESSDFIIFHAEWLAKRRGTSLWSTDVSGNSGMYNTITAWCFSFSATHNRHYYVLYLSSASSNKVAP